MFGGASLFNPKRYQRLVASPVAYPSLGNAVLNILYQMYRYGCQHSAFPKEAISVASSDHATVSGKEYFEAQKCGRNLCSGRFFVS